MAAYLPIRAFNRSQNVRIGGQKVRSIDPTTGLGANTYINIDDPKTLKEFSYHSAIGSVFVTGPITDVPSGVVITSGGETTLGSPSGNQNVTATVASGNFVNRDTATNVEFGGSLSIALTAALTGTQTCVVLVHANTTSGALGFTQGTVVSSGTPATPATPSGKVALGKFTFSKSSTTGAVTSVTDLRPLAP